ncbi:MAG TPA: type II toxin-antitoxin system Phd/YefM family antitoxin [Ramlibacter sp.]|nr:type II toxin-antitoxin system Phd/YefM family antitoxin [Ramlibacter sp.]
MKMVPASYAKQNFGEVLGQAARAPVGIQRHGKLVAALVPPDFLVRGAALDERRAARSAQRQVELARLAAHQRLAIELLCATAAQQRAVIEAARREVDRWQDKRLCSPDYIERWREWLALPVKLLAARMCSPAEGWGTAMRQNTPFILATPEAP